MRKRLAVLGRPVAHSRSPAMQNAALVELGLAGGWSYEAIEVTEEGFAALLRSMPADGFVGANVTVPHKVAALELADQASEAARAIGAANTVSFDRGRIVVENTDATGFLESLPTSPTGLRALLLGAGGAARAVAWALVAKGAEVSIWNRTSQRAERLAADFHATAVTGDERLANGCDLVVNATTVGMGTAARAGDSASLGPLPLDAETFDPSQVVVDLAYGPGDTELVRAARAAGATAVDGLEVLVRQGAASLRVWTGMEPPLEEMRRAVRA